MSFQIHAHHSFEVVFCLEGEMVCELDDEVYILTKGDVLFICPGQVHSYSTPKKSKSYLCVFSNDLIDAFYKSLSGKKLSKPLFNEENSLDLIESLKSDKSIFFKKAALYYLAARALENSKLVSVEKSNFALQSQLAFYVQNNFDKELSLREFARKEGYNYTYISNFFNHSFKQNFPSYVNKFRLQHAEKLLLSTDKDVTEIVLESGFSTIRNFNIAFKKEYGVSPTEMRNKSR